MNCAVLQRVTRLASSRAADRHTFLCSAEQRRFPKTYRLSSFFLAVTACESRMEVCRSGLTETASQIIGRCVSAANQIRTGPASPGAWSPRLGDGGRNFGNPMFHKEDNVLEGKRIS